MESKNYYLYRLFFRRFTSVVFNNSVWILKLLKASVFNISVESKEYLVVRDKKLIYIVNSKAACSSIKRALIESVASKEISVNNYSDIHKCARQLGYQSNHLNKEERSWYKFTFVRDPFKRLVSLYVNKFEDREKLLNIGFFQYQKYLGGILHQNMSFEDFVKFISKIPDKFAERHFVSQSFLLTSEREKINYIGKVENIEEDYKLICEEFGLKNNLRKSNRSPEYDYRDYYTLEILNLVYNRYKRDIVDFGYDREYKELKAYIEQRKNDIE